LNTAERLRIIRGELKQIDFAAALGIHKNTLGRYERGETEPDSGVCAKICTIFGISPAWLLLGVEPMLANAGGGQPPSLETQPSIPASCPRCAKLEAKLEKIEEQRDELVVENRQLLRENGELRVQLARLEERIEQVGVMEMRGGAA